MQLGNRVWSVAIKLKSESAYTVIRNPHFSWLADPFVCESDGHIFIFAEMMRKKSQKGVIAFAEYHSNVSDLVWTKVVEEPFHLSFPNIIQVGNTWYMMPECGDARKIQIYYSKKFPLEWELYSQFDTDDKYVDSVYYQYDIKKGKGVVISYNLSKQSLDFLNFEGSKYEVIGSVNDNNKCLRPAGQLFVVDDKVIIPTQECSSEYGKSLLFYEIKKCEQNFVITKCDWMCPITLKNYKSKICGFHTYNSSVRYEVIDLKSKCFDFPSYIGRFRRKIQKELSL